MKSGLLACRLATVTLLFSHGAAEAVSGDEIYAKPVQLVTASDGSPLNFYCMGSGSRTVVFDAGHGDWSPSWSVVQPAVAKWTRACSYDRVGVGFRLLTEAAWLKRLVIREIRGVRVDRPDHSFALLRGPRPFALRFRLAE